MNDCCPTDEDCPERADWTDVVIVGVNIEMIWVTRDDSSCALDPLIWFEPEEKVDCWLEVPKELDSSLEVPKELELDIDLRALATACSI